MGNLRKLEKSVSYFQNRLPLPSRLSTFQLYSNNSPSAYYYFKRRPRVQYIRMCMPTLPNLVTVCKILVQVAGPTVGSGKRRRRREGRWVLLCGALPFGRIHTKRQMRDMCGQSCARVTTRGLVCPLGMRCLTCSSCRKQVAAEKSVLRLQALCPLRNGAVKKKKKKKKRRKKNVARRSVAARNLYMRYRYGDPLTAKGCVWHRGHRQGGTQYPYPVCLPKCMRAYQMHAAWNSTTGRIRANVTTDSAYLQDKQHERIYSCLSKLSSV